MPFRTVPLRDPTGSNEVCDAASFKMRFLHFGKLKTVEEMMGALIQRPKSAKVLAPDNFRSLRKPFRA